MGFLDVLDRIRNPRPASSNAVSTLPTASRNMSLVLIPKTQANQPWILDTKFKPLALEGYSRSSVVYACIENLATSVPEPPIKFYVSNVEEEDEEVKVDPQLVTLLEHPNELMSQFDMIEMMTIHLSISGITYWWKERGMDGQVIALWPLRPDRVGPLYSTSTAPGQRVLSHWVYHNPGTNEPVFLPRSDVWFTNYPDPLGPSGGMVEGLGPLIALAREVASDNEATRFVATLLGNYAQPGWAVQIKSTVQSEDEARLLKMKFQSQFGGAHLGEAALLDADTTLTKLSFDLQELEFPALREFSETRIAAAFRTPAILVGLNAGLQRATYSNIQEARKDFTERTLESIWRRIEDSLNRDLVPDFNVKAKAKFDRSKIKALSETRLALTAPIEQGYNAGVVKRNEYRKALSLPPDMTPEGDKYKDTTPASPFGAFGSPFGGNNPTPNGQDPKGGNPMSNGQDPKLPPGTAEGPQRPSWEAGTEDPSDRQPRQPSWVRPKEAKPSFLASKAALKAGSSFEGDNEQLAEEGLPDNVADIVTLARMRYGDAADALIPQLELFLEEQSKRIAAKLKPDLAMSSLEELFPEVEDDFLADILLPFLERLFGVTVDEANATVSTAVQPTDKTQEPKIEAQPKAEEPRDIAVVIGNPEDKDKELAAQSLEIAKKIILDELLDRAKGISDNTRSAVAKIIQDGVEAGKSLPQIAADILGATAFSPVRAAMIARTETALLYNKTAIATYASTGMVKQVSVHDGIEYDEPCIEADGQVWSLEYAMLHPIEHPNCFVGETLVIAPNVVSSYSRWFEGEIVTITTSSGDAFSCTPNHPILTDHGWIAAGLLNVGQHVIKTLDSKRMSRLLDPYNEYVPTPIEQVARSLQMAGGMSARTVPSSVPYFHGDGSGSDVYIERTTSLLRDRDNSPQRQHVIDLYLNRGSEVGQPFFCQSSFDKLSLGSLDPSNSIMSSLGSRLSSGRTSFSRLKDSGLGNRTSDTQVSEPASNRSRMGIKQLTDLNRASLLSEVQPLQDRSTGIDDSTAWMSQRETQALEMTNEGFSIDPSDPRYINQVFAGLITPVEIVEIERRNFAGHVYNLETHQGWYVANGIISANCRRAFAPIFDESMMTLKALKFNPYHDEIGRFARAFHDNYKEVAKQQKAADIAYRKEFEKLTSASGKRMPSDYASELRPKVDPIYFGSQAYSAWTRLQLSKKTLEDVLSRADPSIYSQEQAKAVQSFNMAYNQAAMYGVVVPFEQLVTGKPRPLIPSPKDAITAEGTGVDPELPDAIKSGLVPTQQEWAAYHPYLEKLQPYATAKAGTPEDTSEADPFNPKQKEAIRAKKTAMKLIANRLRENKDFQELAQELSVARIDMETHPNSSFTHYIAGTPVHMIPRFADDATEDMVASLIRLWTISAYDSNPLSIGLQEAAARVFGLPVTKPKAKDDPDLPQKVERLNARHGAALEAFIRAEYEETQEQLKQAGIKELVLTRGLSLDPKAQSNAANAGVKLPKDWYESYYLGDSSGSALSSWTSDRETAFKTFAKRLNNGAIGISRIPAEDIVSMPYSGTGCLEESEFVVKSGKAPTFVAMMKDGIPRGNEMDWLYDRVQR